MNILITGASGFIGRNLSHNLCERGHNVTGLTHGEVEITEPEAFDNIPDSIEHVFHLAARSYVPDSWQYPQAFFKTNVMGTINTLEFCRKVHAGITFISSYVYGKPQYLPVDENHPVSIVSPYHQSKVTGEEFCHFYSDNWEVKCSILRPFNIYGVGQRSSFLMPTIIQQVLDENIKEITVQDLVPKRDYLYIEDVVTALAATLEQKTDFEIFNIGSGTSTSVGDLITQVQTVFGTSKPVISTGNSRRGEVLDCYSDNTKIERAFGIVPAFSLTDGLKDMKQKMENGIS